MKMRVNKDGKIRLEDFNDLRDLIRELYDTIYTIKNDVETIKNSIQNKK